MARVYRIEYDPAKRLKTLQERGLDFSRASEVFRGATLDRVDDRQDYGETRIITAGKLDGRIVVLVWTWRENKRRIISMRYANGREIKRVAQHLD